ncbi:flavodoxin reductase [Flavobacterium ardleyense]|uniref:Flavodoxin reductase n=1 Tax=Flavobacterium ardleyense TaxID=2038737 RepID=A0ABW5Z8Y7_9FLAO
MENYKVNIQSIQKVTPDVLRIVTNKPDGFDFTPGKATELAINKVGWESQKRPFTMTSLPKGDKLEFMIKTYPKREGVTNEMLDLKQNDELLVGDVFGAIDYKGEGVFIAGGAGVTPFISILRQLKANKEMGHNKLIFANKTKSDIILEQEFNSLLGDSFINILSDEDEEGYAFGRITEEFLKENIQNLKQHFYLCGPPPMITAIEAILMDLGIDEKLIIKEEY